MIDVPRMKLFLRRYSQPSLATVQVYIMTFIALSLLSFVSLSRDFASAPILLLQFLSPLVAPVFLYILPVATVSAAFFGWQSDQYTAAIVAGDDKIHAKLRSRMTGLNIAVPLILSTFYTVIFSVYLFEEIDYSTIGLWLGGLAIMSLMGGTSLGGYANQVAYEVMAQPPDLKTKRKLKHNLTDTDNDDQVIVSTEDSQQDTTGQQR